MIASVTTSTTTTGGPRLTINELKESPVAVPMMIFGESPTRVAVPPMLEAMTSRSRNGTGSSSRMSARSRVIGNMSRTVVTLSRKAESTAVTTPR